MNESDAKKTFLEENYEKLKGLFKNSREECLNLNYQISKLKEMFKVQNESCVMFENKGENQV